MRKKDLLILSIIMAMPLIVLFGLPAFFKYNLSQSEWITLVTSCLGTFATIFLGYMVFFQTENHKNRQEEDNALYQEQAEKNRRLDLMIRANPSANFEKIEYFAFTPRPIVLDEHINLYNTLCDAEIQINENQIASNGFMLDLSFRAMAGALVNCVTINKVLLTCFDGIPGVESYKEYLAIEFLNQDHTKRFLAQMAENSFSLKVCLGCKKTSLREDKVIELLKEMQHDWRITVNYTLENSFGVAIDMETECTFKIKKNVAVEIGRACTVKEVCTLSHQESEIYIKD